MLLRAGGRRHGSEGCWVRTGRRRVGGRRQEHHLLASSSKQQHRWACALLEDGAWAGGPSKSMHPQSLCCAIYRGYPGAPFLPAAARAGSSTAGSGRVRCYTYDAVTDYKYTWNHLVLYCCFNLPRSCLSVGQFVYRSCTSSSSSGGATRACSRLGSTSTSTTSRACRTCTDSSREGQKCSRCCLRRAQVRGSTQGSGFRV